MVRTADEIAAQAIICGALGFRASIEVTQHPRTNEFCTRLLPWLEEVEVGSRIDPYHREILETPHGRLSPESQREAYWRGEAAAVYGWAILLFDKPHRLFPISPELLVSNLQLLQPSANLLLADAKLRPQAEIYEYCLYCLEIRHQFQLQSVASDAREALSAVHRRRLQKLGLTRVDTGSQISDIEAADILSAAPHARGLYVVRALSAEWLLGME